MTTPNIGLTELVQSQASKEVTINDALWLIDAFVGGKVLNRTLTTPPASPSEGDIYIPAATAQGAWVGFENYLAIYRGGAWYLTLPKSGMRILSIDPTDAPSGIQDGKFLIWTGSAWSISFVSDGMSAADYDSDGDLKIDPASGGTGGDFSVGTGFLKFTNGTATLESGSLGSGGGGGTTVAVSDKQVGLSLGTDASHSLTGSLTVPCDTVEINEFDSSWVDLLTHEIVIQEAGLYTINGSVRVENFPSTCNRYEVSIKDGSDSLAQQRENRPTGTSNQVYQIISRTLYLSVGARLSLFVFGGLTTGSGACNIMSGVNETFLSVTQHADSASVFATARTEVQEEATLYLDLENGDDESAGNAAGSSAFRTFEKSRDVIKTYDTFGETLTLQIADTTTPAILQDHLNWKPPAGNGLVKIQGNPTNPENVVLRYDNPTPLKRAAWSFINKGRWMIEGLSLQSTTTDTDWIVGDHHADLTISNMRWETTSGVGFERYLAMFGHTRLFLGGTQTLTADHDEFLTVGDCSLLLWTEDSTLNIPSGTCGRLVTIAGSSKGLIKPTLGNLVFNGAHGSAGVASELSMMTHSRVTALQSFGFDIYELYHGSQYLA